MSEYQYYEFQAIDRPLSEADRRALRDLSTRARITATSFTNSYEWGDFSGDPDELMERWFDLHLYLANWGSRRLMLKLPARLLDRDRVGPFLEGTDCATLQSAGQNVIVSIWRDELESEDWDDGANWLAALAPLRSDLLAGDLRLFYLLWLTAVEADSIEPGEPEPMPGIGPLTGALEAFAEFFCIDPDLVRAAAERTATADREGADGARRIIEAMTDDGKTALLMRVFDGEPHVRAELRSMVRERLATRTVAPAGSLRTVAELQQRAAAIRLARERAVAEQAARERQLREKEAERARQARIQTTRHRGENAWADVENEIQRRNAAGYDKAVALLADLLAIAEKDGTTVEFRRRLQAIRERHDGKGRFIERLQSLG